MGLINHRTFVSLSKEIEWGVWVWEQIWLPRTVGERDVNGASGEKKEPIGGPMEKSLRERMEMLKRDLKQLSCSYKCAHAEMHPCSRDVTLRHMHSHMQARSYLGACKWIHVHVYVPRALWPWRQLLSKPSGNIVCIYPSHFSSPRLPALPMSWDQAGFRIAMSAEVRPRILHWLTGLSKMVHTESDISHSLLTSKE